MLAEKAEYPITLMARILCVSRPASTRGLPTAAPKRAGRPSASREARLAGVGPQVRREVRGVLPARRVLRIDPVSGTQADARAGHTRPHAKPAQAHRDSRPQGQARARPGAPRLHEPGPHLQARGRHHLPAHRRGRLHLATVIDLSTRMAVGWSLSGRMTADIAVAALESAKSRGYAAGTAIFHTDRGAQHAGRLLAEWRAPTTCGLPAAARETAATTPSPSRSSPRWKTRCAAAGDSPPGPRPGTQSSSSSSVLQQAEAAFLDRLQGAGRSHGRLLRADRAQARLLRAARSQARRDAYGSMIPLNSVSEILTQVIRPARGGDPRARDHSSSSSHITAPASARATRPRGRSPRPWRPCGCWRRWRTSPPSRPRTPGQPAGSARQYRRGRSYRSAAWDAHGDRARTGLQPPLAVAVAAVRPSSAQLVDHRVNDLVDEDFGERAHELMEVHHPVVEAWRTLGAGASIWFTLCIAVISLHRIRLSQLQILRRWPLLCFRPLHRDFRHDRHFRMPLDEINGTAA